MSEKWIYFFGDGSAEGSGDQKELLGGKGAGLAFQLVQNTKQL